uniref:hypothetical protein n=1 Tax=Saccharothrix deserti TaxID=2593674 RepID=UPI001EE49A69
HPTADAQCVPLGNLAFPAMDQLPDQHLFRPGDPIQAIICGTRGKREDVMVSDDTGMGGVVVEDSGDAEAMGAGEANTGAETGQDDTRAVRVTGSGKAVAEGPGSVANTGVRRVPRA